jgi:hypothetical protein
VIELGNADPLDRRMALRYFAAKQADPTGADNGKPDALRDSFMRVSAELFRSFPRKRESRWVPAFAGTNGK